MLPLRSKSDSTPEECRVIPWFSIDGDRNLRIDYNLNSASVVYDVGGYEGAWAADIYHKYECNIEVFEPVKEFSAEIERRFASKPKIHTNAFGLADKTRKATITHDGASSSNHKTSQDSEIIQLVRAADFF